MSNRIIATESPSIEDVLETYEVVPGITSLALGSVHWSPPEEALAKLVPALSVRATHRYGNVLGDDDLRDHLKQLVQRQGIDMTDMDLTVTAGGNQAFVNTVLTLLDDKDHAILLAPFYFAHKLGLQMVGATVDVCPFNKSTLEPEWDKLIEMTQKLRPKMIILTSPNNPSGYVYSEAQVRRVVEICRECDAWLVADQTYHEFLYDDAQHVYPCGSAPVFNYAKIVHLFSFSKLFGMPGWRVGYMVHPEHLTEHMRKVQDMIPTHAAIMSQTLALECLRSHYPLEGPDAYYPKHLPLAKDNYTVWAERTVGSMEPFRRALWPVLQPLGTVYARGAFYFLVPVPDLIDENEALHILSTEFKVMLMTGSAFGAPGHLRVSYGNIKPSEIEACVDKIKRGFAHLLEMSSARKQKAQI